MQAWQVLAGRCRVAGLACLLLLATNSATWSQEKNILWLNANFPPFFISEAAYRNQGIGDEILNLLEENLPDYKHERQVANLSRQLKEMGEGHPVCSTAKFRTREREEIMVFSVPIMVIPPNGITVRRQDLKRFGGGAPVSLATLLGDPTLHLGITRDRSYGKGIDSVLQRYSRAPYVHYRGGGDHYMGLLQMLVKGRVDYLVGFPYEAIYVARQLGLENEIAHIQLTEAGGYTPSYVACSKNEWGQGVIERVNDILRRERPTNKYRGFIERWLDPDGLVEFRKAYKKQLLQR